MEKMIKSLLKNIFLKSMLVKEKNKCLLLTQHQNMAKLLEIDAKSFSNSFLSKKNLQKLHYYPKLYTRLYFAS